MIEIEQIIEKLPPNVKEFVENNVEFSWINNVGAITLPTKKYKPIIIVYTKEIPAFIIAHEIAHAWLEHISSSTQVEEEADKQAEKWGFKIDRNITDLDYLMNEYKKESINLTK